MDSLFKVWNTVTLETVYHSCEVYFKYADTAIEAQNLNLSWELLMANVDSDVRAIVGAEISSYLTRDPKIAQSGPMAFWIIANRIIWCTDGLAHNVVTGVMGMGLIHFKGENVVDCVATLRNVLVFLGHGTDRSQCPPTLMKVLADVFLRCSNPVFVGYVRNLQDFHGASIPKPEDLFAKVQEYYNELLMKPNGWLKTTKNRAAFLAELPELAALMESQGISDNPRIMDTGANETISTSNQSSRNNRSTRQANAAGSQVTQLPGRDAQGRWTHDKKGNPIDRNAPRQGQPTSRSKPDGSTEYWCGECDRWGNHDNEHHSGFIERRNRFRNRQGNGNGNNNNNNNNTNGSSQGNPGGQPPSMHRATVARPFISLLTGRTTGDFDYQSDGSF